MNHLNKQVSAGLSNLQVMSLLFIRSNTKKHSAVFQTVKSKRKALLKHYSRGGIANEQSN